MINFDEDNLLGILRSKTILVMDKKVKLSVLGFSFNQSQTGTYGLVLAEEDGLRRLVVMIGTPEAQSIAFKLQDSAPPRPLTHDLMYDILSAYNIDLLEVNIYKYENGVFYSSLVLKQGEWHVEIESRTSDAVSIALRMSAPIYTTEAIMSSLSVVFDEDNLTKERLQKDDLDISSLDYSQLEDDELKTMLTSAVKEEDYELASILRDELRKRNI